MYYRFQTFDPTVLTTAYAAGDCVCEKLTLSGASHQAGKVGLLDAVVVVDQSNSRPPLDLLFFSQDPTGTTFTEGSALDIADADLDFVTAIVNVEAADYQNISDNAVAVLGNLGQYLYTEHGGDQSCYIAVLSRGIFTFTATGDLRLRVGYRRGVDF